jgi:ferredoxin-type protein NapH
MDTKASRARNAPLQAINGILFVALLVGGWFYYPLGYFLIFCMVIAMGIGFVKGRNWCDWMCPRGSFWDKYLSRFSRNMKVPKIFRSVPFRLFWLGFLMTMLAVGLRPVWGDFHRMGTPFMTILTVTTIIGLILGLAYHERAWCMFCPMGTMANWLGHGKQPLRIAETCSNCGSCEKVCRMQIYPGAFREAGVVSHGDCLKCSYCVETCPKKALTFAR